MIPPASKLSPVLPAHTPHRKDVGDVKLAAIAKAPFPSTEEAQKAWACALVDPTLADVREGSDRRAAANVLLHALTSLLQSPLTGAGSGCEAAARSLALRARLESFARQLLIYADLAGCSTEDICPQVQRQLVATPAGGRLLLPCGWAGHAVAVSLRRDGADLWSLTLFNTGSGLSFHPTEISATGTKQRANTAMVWSGVRTERLLRGGATTPLLRGLLETGRHPSADGMCTPAQFYELVHTLCGTEPASTTPCLQTAQRAGTCAVQCLYAALHDNLGDPAAYKRVKTDLLMHLGRAGPLLERTHAKLGDYTQAHALQRTHNLVRANARANLLRNLDKHLAKRPLDAAAREALREATRPVPRRARGTGVPLRKEVLSTVEDPTGILLVTPRPAWPAQAQLPLPKQHLIAFDPGAADLPKELGRALENLVAAAQEQLDVQGDPRAAMAALQSGLAALPEPCSAADCLYDAAQVPLSAWRPAQQLQQICLTAMQRGVAAFDGTGSVLTLVRASALLERLALRQIRAGLPPEYHALLAAHPPRWPFAVLLWRNPANVDRPKELDDWLTARARAPQEKTPDGGEAGLFDYGAGIVVLYPESLENRLLRAFFCPPGSTGVVPDSIATCMVPPSPGTVGGTPAREAGAQALIALRRCMLELHLGTVYQLEAPHSVQPWVRRVGSRGLSVHFNLWSPRAALQPTTAFAHATRQAAVTEVIEQENSAIEAPKMHPELPVQETNRLRLLGCLRLSRTALHAAVAHYQTHVRDLLQPDAQLELLLACRVNAWTSSNAGPVHNPALQQLDALLQRLGELAVGEVQINLFRAEVSALVCSLVPATDSPPLPATQHALRQALHLGSQTAATPQQRAASALGAVSTHLPGDAPPTLTHLILAQASGDDGDEIRPSMRRRFQAVVARLQGAAHRARSPFAEAEARAAFQLLGWPWPTEPWAERFPYASAGDCTIDWTTGIVRRCGIAQSLCIPRAVQDHPAYAALVGSHALRTDSNGLAWAHGVYATLERGGVRFAKRFPVDGMTAAAYEWMLPRTYDPLPESLCGGHHVWQAIGQGAPRSAIVTDLQLEPVAAVLPPSRFLLACAGLPPPSGIECLRGANRGRRLGHGNQRTPHFTPQQTWVWCNRRGQPRGVEIPRFNLSFTEGAGGWRWDEKPQFTVAAHAPIFFARAGVPAIALCRGNAQQPICKVLVPRVDLATQGGTQRLQPRTPGHGRLADANRFDCAPAVMELEVCPVAGDDAAPTPALRTLREDWSGAADLRLRATRPDHAVRLALYYTADKDYTAAVQGLRELVATPHDGWQTELYLAAGAFDTEVRNRRFCDDTAHGRAVAAHVLKLLVSSLGGALLPAHCAYLVKRYLGYLDSRHNVEPALQLTLDEERALLVALPAWQLSAVLHQRAAALGISLPEVPAAAAATAAADPGRTTAPCSRSVMAILYSAKMAAYWGSEPFVTPYVPDEASAAASYGRIIVQLSGWPARRLETRLQQLGVTEGVACLRGRLAMARLPADSDAAALRNLLCNLLTHPQRLTELPAYLESQSFEPLPEAWFADAALPMRPMPAPQAPRVATPQILDEARPPAPPLPSGANLLAWTGSTQPPLWQHPKIGAAAQPAALPELPWSAPADADPVLREQMTALQAGLLRAAPQAFDMTGLAQPFDASARRQLLHAAVQQSARLQTSPGAVEALANVRTAHLTAHQRLRLEAGLDQRITLEHIVAALARDHMAALRSHNAALSDATLSALRQQAIAHLVAATQAQLMRRVQTLLASPEAEDSLRRKLGAAIASRRCYDPQRHPALLAFEYRNDLLLRRDQVVALHTLLQNIDASGAADRGCILQLPMGAGKTKVLLPLLAHYAAGPQRLPVVVVPPALLAVNHSDLARTSMRTFGQRCARFDFARGDPHDLERLEILHRNLALLMRQRGYLITTAAAIQSLNLAYQGALDDGDSRRVTALAQLVTRFADQGVAFIDEADQALDVRNEVVFGVGHTQPLPMGMRAAMVHLYTCMLEDPALVARIDLVNDRQATLTPEIYATEVAPRLRDAYVEHSAQVHGGGLRAAYARSPQLRALLADTDMSAQAQAAALAQVPEEARESLALGRLLLLTTLPSCLQRNSGQHYGLPDARWPHAVAVPYRQGQPKHGSEFGCPYEAACYTLQNAAHQHTRLTAEHTGEVLTQLQTKARQQTDLEGSPIAQTEAAESWRDLLAGTPFVDQPVNADLHRTELAARLAAHLNGHAAQRLRWVANVALSAIGSYAEQAVSDAFDLTAAFRVRRGFTGTPWNRQTYALDCQTNDATLEVLRRGLLQNPATRTCVCAVEDTPAVVRAACAASPRPQAVRVLLDVGAFYRNAAAPEVAAAFLQTMRAEHLPNATGVLFFGRGNGGLQYLAHGADTAVAVQGSTPEALKAQGIGMEQTLVYLDEAHCTGTDLPLPRNAVGIATLSGQTLARDLEQGIMRLRGLGSGQSVVLCASPAAAAAGIGVVSLYLQAQRNQANQLGRDKVQSLRRQVGGAAGRAAVQRMRHQPADQACAHFAAHRPLLVHGTALLPSQRLGATQMVPTAEALRACLARACEQTSAPGERQALLALWPQLAQHTGALPHLTHMATQQGHHVERQTEVEQEIDRLRFVALDSTPKKQAPSIVAVFRAGGRPQALGSPLREVWPDARRSLLDPDLAISDDDRWTHADDMDPGIPRKRPIFLLAYIAPGAPGASAPSFVCISQTEASDFLSFTHWPEAPQLPCSTPAARACGRPVSAPKARSASINACPTSLATAVPWSTP